MEVITNTEFKIEIEIVAEADELAIVPSIEKETEYGVTRELIGKDGCGY